MKKNFKFISWETTHIDLPSFTNKPKILNVLIILSFAQVTRNVIRSHTNRDRNISNVRMVIWQRLTFSRERLKLGVGTVQGGVASGLDNSSMDAGNHASHGFSVALGKVRRNQVTTERRRGRWRVTRQRGALRKSGRAGAARRYERQCCHWIPGPHFGWGCRVIYMRTISRLAAQVIARWLPLVIDCQLLLSLNPFCLHLKLTGLSAIILKMSTSARYNRRASRSARGRMEGSFPWNEFYIN